MNGEYVTIVKILEVARLALQCDEVKMSLATLKNFPAGSCGDASLLIANLLASYGFADFRVVYGEKECPDDNGYPILKTHAWLENKIYLIDITADQFPELENYIIKAKTTPIDEHLGFVPVSIGTPKLGFTGMAWPAFRDAFDKAFVAPP